MKFLFFIAVFNAFFFTILLFQKKKKSFYDFILILWLLYLGVFIGIYSMYSHDLFLKFKMFSVSFISWFLLQGPFLYVYVSSVLTHRKRFQKRFLFHLIPFVLFNVYLIGMNFSPNGTELIGMDNLHLGMHKPLLFLLFLIVTILSVPFYVVMSIRQFNRYDVNIFNNLSFVENIKFKWLRKLIYVYGIIWTILIIITVIHHVFNIFSLSFCTDGLFLCLSILVLLIGYYGLKLKIIVGDTINDASEFITLKKHRYSTSKLSESEETNYKNKLLSYLKENKPFLDSNLTLSQLAKGIGITSHLLSQIINEQFNLNFFDFINNYRVEEFKNKLIDPKNEGFTLLGIAMDSGFNSKSSFNRIFKNNTNLTPTQYKAFLNKNS